MQFEEREFLPVILGADITAYSLARSFHEEYSIKSLVLSKSKRGYIVNSDIIENRIFPELDKLEVLKEVLLKTGREFENKKKLIILGCGDWYVRNIIELEAELSPYYIIPYIGLELLDRLVLKDSFYGILEELGIPYPETYIYTTGEENSLDFSFPYPVIAKPADSAAYYYVDFPGKKKVFSFDTEAELKEMLERLEASGYKGKFLIQDTVPGDDSYMRVLTCYCDKNSKVRFSSLGRTLLEEHTPSAIGNPAVIVNEVNPKIEAQAARLLEHVGYTGFANFDVKYDSRDGEYKFFEINVRLGRSNFYITGSGFNAVKRIVDEHIYGRTEDYTTADREHLYSVVPKGVIRKYAAEGELKDRALALLKSGDVSYPLLYEADKNIRHRLYARLALLNQYRKYAKYFDRKN